MAKYDGRCLDADGLRYGIQFIGSSENSLYNCQKGCEEITGCVAFSYQHDAAANWGCYRYQSGPTSGNGNPNTTCYVLKQGTLLSLWIYIFE